MIVAGHKRTATHAHLLTLRRDVCMVFQHEVFQHKVFQYDSPLPRLTEKPALGGMAMLPVTHEMEFAVTDPIVFAQQGKAWEARPLREFSADPRTPQARQCIDAGAIK